MTNYIHKALLRLRDEGPKTPCVGICGNLEEFLDEMFEEDDKDGNAEATVRSLMLYKGTKWPKHSGCNTYPVPHPDADPSYHTFEECTDLANSAYHTLKRHAWDTNHPYGKLRAEFVEFLIERTK
jgi:hypothetical protein